MASRATRSTRTTGASGSATASPAAKEKEVEKEAAVSEKKKGPNPLAFLGLKRVGDEEFDVNDPDSPAKSPGGGMLLNSRGIPARKRKKNSLIFGDDDLVSIPIKSPRKKAAAAGSRSAHASPLKPSASASPAKRKILEFKEEKVSEPTKPSRRGNLAAAKSAPTTPAATDKKPPPSPRKTPASKKQPQQTATITTRPALEPLTTAPETAAATTSATAPTTTIATPTPKAMPTKKRKIVTGKRGKKSISGKSMAMDDLELTSPEKKSAQSLGVALRNLLKLPKAHKWVCYEFFYSNIDRVLFEGETDFMVCLRESFPLLKTRRLSRVEWCKIRRMMGKPRRCSQAFFAEERLELARKRHKIRLLQQRKQRTEEMSTFKDLPDDIPIQLTIGARVTARLRKPQDGLFTGTVDAYDTSNSTYRITFDRSGLGTHSIPDFEVLSTTESETVPLTTFTNRPKPRPVPVKEEKTSSALPTPASLSPYKYGLYSPGLANDPLLSGSTPKGKVMRIDGLLGGYPVRFLEQIVRLSKCLKLKRERVTTLRELNSLGERKKSFGEYITEDFQKRYAATVLELSQLNRDLNEHLENIREYTQQFSNEAGPTISLPNIIREGCQEDAYNMVNKNNAADADEVAASGEAGQERKEYVENPKILALISSLTAMMLQVKQLADGERNAFELQALQDSIAEVKQNVSSENLGKFENNIEVHMGHIQSGLSQMGNLHAFMQPKTAPSFKLEPF